MKKKRENHISRKSDNTYKCSRERRTARQRYPFLLIAAALLANYQFMPVTTAISHVKTKANSITSTASVISFVNSPSTNLQRARLKRYPCHDTTTKANTKQFFSFYDHNNIKMTKLGMSTASPQKHTSDHHVSSHDVEKKIHLNKDVREVTDHDVKNNVISLQPKTATTTPPRTSQNTGPPVAILNTNARAVTPKLIPIVQSIFGADNVYVTSTEEESIQAASQIFDSTKEKRPNMIIPMGGDGTLSSVINHCIDEIVKQSQEKTVDDAMKSLPYIGYVPLGTGNGVGSVVGCAMQQSWVSFLNPLGRNGRKMNRVTDALQKLKCMSDDMVLKRQQGSDEEEGFGIVEMPMIEVTHHNEEDHEQQHLQPPIKGDLCFFAGVGFDSLMLDDFKAIKAWSRKTGVLTRPLSSVLGYCVALVVKTLPKAVIKGQHRIHVDLMTRDEDTLWVDHRRGDVVLPVAKKNNKSKTTRLFSGVTGILAAGTSPFYGGGLRLFPFARLTKNKMHLRIGRINPMVGFMNIPGIFAGSYRDKSMSHGGVLDFIGDDFEAVVTCTVGEEEVVGTEEGETNGEKKKEKKKKKGYPFQHSGESVGHKERFRLRAVKENVKFVSFMDRPSVELSDL